MTFIVGRKIEMTQQFKDDGTVVAVTLIRAEPNVVTQVCDPADCEHRTVQIGFEVSSKLNKPESGHLKDLPQVQTLKEFRVAKDADFSRGDSITVESFSPGNHVDVTGVSKGKGFAGVMKRHGFKCGQATHGNKDQQRMPGSIASFPQGKIIKGKRMAGRMGTDRVTVKNLEVISIDPKNHVIAIKGAVPGARGGLVMIKTREGKSVWQA